MLLQAGGDNQSVISVSIFNEDSHSLKFTLMVGNTYECYQEIVPVEKWAYSAVKDNEPLEINYMEYMNLFQAKRFVH